MKKYYIALNEMKSEYGWTISKGDRLELIEEIQDKATHFVGYKVENHSNGNIFIINHIDFKNVIQ